MRILHVLGATGWGGAERIACTLHRLARQHGHESRLEVPNLPEVVDGVRQETRERLDNPAERGLWHWALAARARAARFQPDVVHLHLATPGLCAATAWIAGALPSVTTFQLLPAERWPNDYLMPLSSARVARFLLRASPRRVFVGVSRGDGAKLADRFGRARVRVVVNAPALPPENPSSAPRERWPAGCLRLLAVGRLHEQKGLDRLLLALSAPAVRVLPWYLVVLGDGPERARLQALTGNLGLESRIDFFGAGSAADLFGRADLVVCPSRFEGMPLVPMEAILAGTPVLLSSIEPHLELLAHAPRSFFPNAEADWSDFLARTLAERDALGALEAEQARTFDEDPRQRLFRDYQAIYEELAIA